MTISRFGLFVAILSQAAFLYGQQIIRDYNHSVDFSQFKTYAWLEKEEIPIFRAGIPADMQKGNDQEIDSKIREEVDKILQKKKFQKVAAGSADFLVSYILVTKLEMDVQEYDSSVGADPRVPYGHWRPFYSTSSDVLMRRQGTLTLDIINPESNELFWRGTAVESLKEKDSEKKALKKIEDVIKKTLGKFPPN